MKKMISLLLALVMALSLVACGAGNDIQNDDAAGTDAAPANALEQIKADGVLTVAVSPDFSPMEFVDSSKTGQEQYMALTLSWPSTSPSTWVWSCRSRPWALTPARPPCIPTAFTCP